MDHRSPGVPRSNTASLKNLSRSPLLPRLPKFVDWTPGSLPGRSIEELKGVHSGSVSILFNGPSLDLSKVEGPTIGMNRTDGDYLCISDKVWLDHPEYRKRTRSHPRLINGSWHSESLGYRVLQSFDSVFSFRSVEGVRGAHTVQDRTSSFATSRLSRIQGAVLSRVRPRRKSLGRDAVHSEVRFRPGREGSQSAEGFVGRGGDKGLDRRFTGVVSAVAEGE